MTPAAIVSDRNACDLGGVMEDSRQGQRAKKAALQVRVEPLGG
jgi:hypothetical protein